MNRLCYKSNLLSVDLLPNIGIYLISTLFAQRSIHLRHFLFSKVFPLQAFLERSPNADVTFICTPFCSSHSYPIQWPTKLVHKEVSDICIHLANKEVIKT